MDVGNLSLFEVLFIGVVIVAICVAVVKYVKSYITKAKEADDLVAFIIGDIKDKILPTITSIAFKEELIGCSSFEEFKEKCINSLSSGLFDFLKNEKDVIPENLKQFLTIDVCTKVVYSIVEHTDVDEILKDAYDKKQKEAFRQIEEEEKKAAALAKETGVEDETKLEKEKVYDTEEEIQEEDLIDISEDLHNL